jgi:cephalosporin hydroxylase
MSGVKNLMGDIAWHAYKSNGFVVELGVFAGEGSLRAIQDGLEAFRYRNLALETLHISVDWDPTNLSEHRPKVSWWRFVQGDTRDDSTLAAVNAIAEGRKAGLIYIDTLHDGHQVKAELELWSQIATDETVWLGHDSWMYGVYNEDMMKAVIEWAAAHNWKYEDYRQDSHGLWRLTR